MKSNVQPGMHRHMHHEGHHQHDFPIPMDVESREDAFVISAMLPGIKPEDVDIQIAEGDRLDPGRDSNWKRMKKPPGWYASARAAVSAAASSCRPAWTRKKAKASFENGILTLNIPKSPEARPKTIKVNVK